MAKSIFRPNFTKQDLQKWIARCQERALQSLIDLLTDTGEFFIENAKMGGEYTDRTGNLRASIGYVVAHNGKAIRLSDFQPEQGKPFHTVEFTTKDGKNVRFKARVQQFDGSIGANRGRDFAGELASQYPQGLVLIMCAGMEYALFVEANGYDVITGAAMRAKMYLGKRLRTMLN